jgi:hypothetical protein
MAHSRIDYDKITIEVRLISQGVFDAFSDGSPGVHDAGTGGEEL